MKKSVSYIPQHASYKHSSFLFGFTKFLLTAVAVLLTSVLGVSSFVVYDLLTSLRSVPNGVVGEGGVRQAPPLLDSIEGGFNMLVVASDTREGQDAIFGETDDELADVVMLVSVNEAHTSTTVVSFPRDLMIDVPSCTNDGVTVAGGVAQINSTLRRGGVDCVRKTVESVSGLVIPYVVLVDFNAVIAMSDALGGVNVCLSEPINDPYTGTFLSAGEHELQGLAAVQFLRTRHGVGDGSDLGRISVQQVFLSALVRKLKSENVLTDPARMYSLAKVVTNNVRLSENLNNVTTLVSMGKVVSDVELSDVVFLRAPVFYGEGENVNRVFLVEDVAEQIFVNLRNGSELTVSGEDTGEGSIKVDTVAPDTLTPVNSDKVVVDESIAGQKASDITCTK